MNIPELINKMKRPRMARFSNDKYIKSGINNIDNVIPGLKRGYITEIYGESQSGKSILALQYIKNLTKFPDEWVLYVNASNSFDLDKARTFGLDLDIWSRTIFLTSPTKNLLLEAVHGLSFYNCIDLIVIDDACGIIDSGTEYVDLKRNIQDLVTNTQVAVLILNQVRTVPYKGTRPFGYRTKCIEDARIKVTRDRSIKKNYERIGFEMEITLEHSRSDLVTTNVTIPVYWTGIKKEGEDNAPSPPK